jgi:hypothetical protein
MICAKRVLPRYTRYSESKARSVHESTLAVQVGDTPDGVASRMNKAVQLGACCFNRTLVVYCVIAQTKQCFQGKVDEHFQQLLSRLVVAAMGVA